MLSIEGGAVVSMDFFFQPHVLFRVGYSGGIVSGNIGVLST